VILVILLGSGDGDDKFIITQETRKHSTKHTSNTPSTYYDWSSRNMGVATIPGKYSLLGSLLAFLLLLELKRFFGVLGVEY